MDNNNSPINNLTIDPNQMAPQGTAPTTPPVASTTPPVSHLIDITPGADEAPAPISPSTSPSLSDFAPISPTASAPIVSTTPTPESVAAPQSEAPVIAPVAPPVTVTPQSPLQEDPNLVQTI